MSPETFDGLLNRSEATFAATIKDTNLAPNLIRESVINPIRFLEFRNVPVADGYTINRLMTPSRGSKICLELNATGVSVSLPFMQSPFDFQFEAFRTSIEASRIFTSGQANAHKVVAQLTTMFTSAAEKGADSAAGLYQYRQKEESRLYDTHWALIEFSKWFIRDFRKKLFNGAQAGQVDPLTLLPDFAAVVTMYGRFAANSEMRNSDETDLLIQSVKLGNQTVAEVLKNSTAPGGAYRGFVSGNGYASELEAEHLGSADMGSVAIPGPNDPRLVEAVAASEFSNAADTLFDQGKKISWIDKANRRLAAYADVLSSFRFTKTFEYGRAADPAGSATNFNNELGALIDSRMYAFLMAIHREGYQTLTERIGKNALTASGITMFDLIFEAVIAAEQGMAMPDTRNADSRKQAALNFIEMAARIEELRTFEKKRQDVDAKRRSTATVATLNPFTIIGMSINSPHIAKVLAEQAIADYDFDNDIETVLRVIDGQEVEVDEDFWERMMQRNVNKGVVAEIIRQLGDDKTRIYGLLKLEGILGRFKKN